MAINAVCEQLLKISAYFSSDGLCNEVLLTAEKIINIDINPPPYSFFYSGNNPSACPQGTVVRIGIKDANGVIITFPDYGGAFNSSFQSGVFRNTARAKANLTSGICRCPPDHTLIDCLKPCCIANSLIIDLCERLK